MADIFETCDLINQYIEEKTHKIYEPGGYGSYIHAKGTAARIALTKALKKEQDMIKDMESNNKKRGSKEDYSDAFTKQNDGIRLSAGVNKKDQFLKDTRARSKELYDAYKDYPKAFDKDPEVQSTKEYTKKLLKDTNSIALGKNKEENIKKLRDIKRKYIPESTDARLNIYEAFEAGLITEFEKTELLNILDNIYEE